MSLMDLAAKVERWWPGTIMRLYPFASLMACIAAMIRFVPVRIGWVMRVFAYKGASLLRRPLRARRRFQSIDFSNIPEPVVSVIIPVYNQVHYTHQCLRSLAACRDRMAYEVIVIDDCSTDQTAEWLQRCKGIRVIRNETNLGFLRNCNKAAAEARGKYLVFLNNDTIVTDGWLTEMVNTFTERPDAGLVGAKLIFPYGCLQEAGGIVWDGALAANYGKFGDPRRPEYSYVRAVDYCSGAAIMIPRELFEQLGRFDERYAPAYYEDTDLAFKVREAGKRVYMQPFAKVIHFEGVSSGISLKRGIKKYQLVNQAKFAERWAEVLKRLGPKGNQQLDKDRGIAGRVLVIDRQFPEPDRDSGSVRAFAMLELLVKLGYKVTFFWQFLLHRGRYTEALQRIGVEVFSWPFITHPRSHLRRYGRRYDVIVLSRLELSAWLIDAVRRYAPQAKIVFDTVDLVHLREQREAELANDARGLARAARRKQEELDVIRKADYTLVVSRFEQQILSRESPAADVRVLSNIHRVYGRGKPFADRKDLMFIGSFLHRPNIDAAMFMVEEILPLIAREVPGVKLYLVGGPADAIQKLASEQVVVTGQVPDAAAYFESCRLSVAPLRYGAGVKGKINMSMSYGLPVVGTSIAVEGMFLENEVSAMVADSPQAFAEAVIRLYRDQDLWDRLAKNGLTNVDEHFGEQAAREVLGRLMADAMPTLKPLSR